MTIKELRKLELRASRGDVSAQRALISATDQLKSMVNANLRALERGNWDYGAYNYITNFTQTEYDTNRLKTSKALDYDWYNMRLQSEQAIKFLTRRGHNVQEQKEVLVGKRDWLISEGITPKGTSLNKVKGFLRILGWEESQAIISEKKGASEQIEDMMYDAYQKAGFDESILRKEFTAYLAQRGDENGYTFDVAMERLGVTL